MKYIENSPVFMADRVQDAAADDPQRPGRRGAVVSGDRVLPGAAAAGQGGATCSTTTASRTTCAKRAAARDFAVRMHQFFDHHLKGKPAPEWMEKGVPYLDREKEKDEIRKIYAPPKK